jgi:hypothetical protein
MITGVVGSSQYVTPASSWSTTTTIGTGVFAPLWNGVDTWIGFDEGADDMMTSSPYPETFVDSSTTGWVATTATGPKIAYENGRLFQLASTGVYSSTGPTVAGTQVWSTTTINDLIYFNGTYYAFGDSGVWGTSTNGTTWTNKTTFTTNAIYVAATNGTTLVVGGASGYMAYTTNGTTWTNSSSTVFGTVSVQRMIYANGYFAGTNASGVFAYSSTGQNAAGWTAVSTGLTGAGGVLAFHMGRWVVISAGTENPKVSSSADPTTMTFSNASATTVSGGRSNRNCTNQAYIVWTVSGVTYRAR